MPRHRILPGAAVPKRALTPIDRDAARILGAHRPSGQDHPRLFFDAAHLRRFRAHWSDPAYASVVREYKYDVGLDPVSEALRGLAVDDEAACRLAARTVVADGWRPKINLSSGPPGGFDWKLFGPPEYVYGDAAALVFDWCYCADAGFEIAAHRQDRSAKPDARSRAQPAVPMA